jgi:hypothetical protein
MDFPVNDFLDPSACYDFLVEALHPEGLACPNGHPLGRCYVYRRCRPGVPDYRCKDCGR